MLRFIAFLLKREYEPCKSCETLKEELEIQRSLYQNLTNTLLSHIAPQNVPLPVSIPAEPILRKSWDQRRRELERNSRDKARELRDNIEKLEEETGIKDVSKEQEAI